MSVYLCDHCEKREAVVHDPESGCHLCLTCDLELLWREVTK